MSDLVAHRDEWLALAEGEDRRGEWDAQMGHSDAASKHKAKTYRDVAKAMQIEIDTGVAVCSCCFKALGPGGRHI